MKRCDFCDELSGGSDNACALRYGHSNFGRVVARTRLFRVFPSLGQLAEGHVLIVPTRHICALADLSGPDVQELDRLYGTVRAALRSIYGSCIFFEHGVRREGAGGCGIDHAHMHAVPVAADGVLSVLRLKFQGVRINSLDAISSSIPESSSYLFFETASGDRFVFEVDHLPSQYMRQLVAKSLGSDNWDWRACHYEPELIATIQRLSPLFPATPGHSSE